MTSIPTSVWRSWHCWEVEIVGWLPTSSASLPTRRWIAGAAEPIGDPGKLPPLPRLYSELRSSTAKALLTAESVAIRAMADALPRKLSGKPGHNTRGTKKQKSS